MTRTFTIYQTPTCDEISLSIHEPSLTEDNVGLKTWGSAYLLAQRLDSIGVEFLGLNANYRNERDFPLVLELGSGTGLVGLAAAAVWKCKVILTDLPEIIPNLQSNIACNKKMIIRLGGCVEAHELDWNSPPDPQSHHSLCPVEVRLQTRVSATLRVRADIV